MTQILDAQQLRRELHEMPELALHEVKTAAYIADKLRSLGIETVTGVGGTTGVIGIIRGAEPGPVMMLRADMDALPFVIDGKPCAIHACGHDGHSAMLLAAASRLVGQVKKGTLKLLFQPAEETIEGALAVIRSGMVDDVDIALGAHIRPVQDLPLGACCAAVNHTSSTTAYVTIEGRSCHAARPHLGRNALDIGCAVVQAVQALWLNPASAWSVKATQFHADQGATNSVPARAKITFDMRASSNADMQALVDMVKNAAEHTALALGGEAHVEFGECCPAAEYDDDLVAEVEESIRTVVGADKLAKPCGGGGEDFHHFKLHKPAMKAAYFGVGVGAEPGLHNATMHFDDSKLVLGVDVFVDMVRRHLG